MNEVLGAQFNRRNVDRDAERRQSRILPGTGLAAVGHDTDAHRDVQFVLIHGVQRAQRDKNLVRTDGGILCMRHIREQNHEFIPALPADRVRLRTQASKRCATVLNK